MYNIFSSLIICLFLLVSGSRVEAQGVVPANNCLLKLGGPVTFCETFDVKNPGIPSRSGDLHPDVWGVSRLSGNTNFGGLENGWAATLLKACDGSTSTVVAPRDILICDGKLREASNDNATLVHDAGGVTVLAMYPKQPFDFAGRTGTVSFDISNDSHGTHAAWPEFWFSNFPVPAPFNHFDSWQTLPQHGFGLRFAASADPGQFGSCPNGNNLSQRRWTADSAVVVRNWVMDDTVGLGGVRTNMNIQILDCVIAPADDSGITNHVELKISQNQIDIYATDAGVVPTVANLRRIAVVTNANLSLSRGLIWLQDVHYNADKGAPSFPSQRQHTFVWDNVAFDGPFVYRDFSYDALDALQFNPSTSTWNLGKTSQPNQTSSWSVLNMPANPQAETVRVLFNFYNYDVPTTFSVIVNGHPHTVAWPYPDTQGFMYRTFATVIPITDLVTGNNTVQIGADRAIITSNVNIVLVNVPGGVPVLPGSNNAYPVSGPPPVPVNGVCGSSDGTTVPVAPSTNLCTAGTSSAVAGVGPWTWNCNGANGGTNASCSAQKTPTPVNGVCGSANGVAVSSAPSTNLCSTGASSAVAGTGPWSWSCAGSSGGANASCSAPLSPPTSINGVCGSANGTMVAAAPATANLCSAGTPIGPWKWGGGDSTGATSGPWSWSCNGSNGGVMVNCSASPQ